MLPDTTSTPAGAAHAAPAEGGAHPIFTVVLDDDPTGTQAVRDLPVVTTWTVDDFQWAMQSGSAVYVLTNSRSLPEDEARTINHDAATNALTAAKQTGLRLRFVSRGDSTLRGHFPAETDTIADVLTDHGIRVDGTLLVPAFPEAGRITIDGTHYIRDDQGSMVPVADSEFAGDRTFGYSNSSLPRYVEEKTAGAVPADTVAIVLLRDLTDRTASATLQALTGGVAVADSATENDLRDLAAAAHAAENAGTTLVYRSGPSFVRTLIGQTSNPPIAPDQLDYPTDAAAGGLIVVGSHTGLTSAQLERLLADHPDIRTFELPVTSESGYRDTLADRISAALADGSVVVHTPRQLVATADPAESLAISRGVSADLVAVVHKTLERTTPRFVIAKGGITSHDIATKALEIRRATIRGCLLPGLISVWEPSDDSPHHVPYVVFPGNVGDSASLSAVVSLLTS